MEKRVVRNVQDKKLQVFVQILLTLDIDPTLVRAL